MISKQPTLSVLITNYNHALYLGETLEGILTQSYLPAEVLVIDDASTDNSVEVIHAFARGNPIVQLIRHEQNMGAVHNVNRLLGLASSDFVLFHSADDKLLPGFIEQSMTLLAQYPEAGLCSSLSLLLGGHGEDLGLFQTPIISKTSSFLPPEKALTILRRYGTWFMGNTTIYRRVALIEVGGFIPELQSFCDGFISQVIALKYGACFIPEPLAMWRRMETGYALTTIANPDVAIDIMHHTLQLMRSTYRDLFPADYVDDWQRRWLYGASSIFIVSSQKAQIAGLRRLLSFPARVDRAFLGGLKLLLRIEYLVTKLYLFARLRRVDLWPVLTRKLKHFFQARIVRTDE